MKKIGTAVLLFLVLLSCFPICGYAIEFDMDEICDSVVVVHSMNSVGTGFAISKDTDSDKPACCEYYNNLYN